LVQGFLRIVRGEEIERVTRVGRKQGGLTSDE